MPACKSHGRVRNVHIEEIAIQTNTNRSVMLYGEHTGQFLAGGGVTPGESFDAENIDIFYTRTINRRADRVSAGAPFASGSFAKRPLQFQ